MTDYLILRLSGPMQSWGQPTFEGTRPSSTFPTRSGLLGLMGACLGIKRTERDRLQAVADSVRFAVRCDQMMVEGSSVPVTKLTDYHTIKDARESYSGLKRHETIQTWREYLCDASFTVAVWLTDGASIPFGDLVEAVQKPRFTPYLGRRSCPMTHPLFVDTCQADNAKVALDQYQPANGVIYSEVEIGSANRRLRVRDEPIINLPRQFASREWFVVKGGEVCS